MKAVERIRYPCGYSYFVSIQSFGGTLKTSYGDGCPLHGKQCCRTPYLGKKQTEKK